MYETKTNNLGLDLLIRLNLFIEYLNFLGGKTQRPNKNNQSNAATAPDPKYTAHLDSKKVSRGAFDIGFLRGMQTTS
ncbi:MAG: hypothetical protein DHS20C13_00930 [Thermodesulfobacteriota bacterium]|nr:MAG: hypothetical protein DHS20C13_00930 [Thermodesulfobacteriota bacterium]